MNWIVSCVQQYDLEIIIIYVSDHKNILYGLRITWFGRGGHDNRRLAARRAASESKSSNEQAIKCFYGPNICNLILNSSFLTSIVIHFELIYFGFLKIRQIMIWKKLQTFIALVKMTGEILQIKPEKAEKAAREPQICILEHLLQWSEERLVIFRDIRFQIFSFVEVNDQQRSQM